MVYIHSWQEFQDAAESLYAKAPNKARYCVKWKSSEGKLVLKITDDVTCLKFKTNSSIFLNRFEALNLSLMQKMQNSKPHEEPTGIATPALLPPAENDRANSPAPAQTTSALPSASVAGGGVKKKKPKKKK
ncbi:signal recognition particle SRP9 SRP14 subunit [Pholiota conissans]|uniref:Signal recognition particle SRP9 SRP14 subunit n=1 Tax=Pholiota conissans TaxID=109636 RepID=A0A9P5ZDS8_9AGAR|nr:signal recognition particle SRP9 SRP14 subunit [Pholiota conissans]